MGITSLLRGPTLRWGVTLLILVAFACGYAVGNRRRWTSDEALVRAVVEIQKGILEGARYSPPTK